jgi:hypothetical protein
MRLNLKPIDEHSYSYDEGLTLAEDLEDYKDGMRQIDWDVVKNIVESKNFDKVEVGLAEDYKCTHAIIFKNEQLIIEENISAGFYGASTWATPAIKVTKNGKSELFECWILGEQTGFPAWLTKNAKRI